MKMAYLDEKMNRTAFLHDRSVQDFVQWIHGALDQPGKFKHHYYLKKAKTYWQCDCLFDAFKRYWWPFDFYCPFFKKRISGATFEDSFEYLSHLANLFRYAIQENNIEETKKCSFAALTWGGVINRNNDRINEMGNRICKYFQDIQMHLSLNDVQLKGNNWVVMNSGFTKLYSLIVDDFIMYDGRVGAALGMLGRIYSAEHNLPGIPKTIEFSYGSGRVSPNAQLQNDRRNPSNTIYQLPSFNGRSSRQLEDNIKASWLVKSIADSTCSPFSSLPQNNLLNKRITAIQAALFMIGYDVSSMQTK